jgi:hypothetical protein
VEEGGAGLLRHRWKAGALGPVAQCLGITGERQAALDEQADQFLGGAGERCRWGQQAKGEEEDALQRRSSIWIGPSRRPWVN